MYCLRQILDPDYRAVGQVGGRARQNPDATLRAPAHAYSPVRRECVVWREKMAYRDRPTPVALAPATPADSTPALR